MGLAADIRDLGAAISHVSDGKDGAWLELRASIIGFVPGGDIAKGIAKTATKAATRAAVKASVELVDDAAKVLKGSTAAAADGLSSVRKTAGTRQPVHQRAAHESSTLVFLGKHPRIHGPVPPVPGSVSGADAPGDARK